MLTESIQNNVIQIPVALITPNPKQPRKKFDQQELDNLTASVKEHGVIQPLLVCPPDPKGVHVLIAGERRLRAAQSANLKIVPAIIRNVDGSNLRILALVENVLRADMSPVEEGDAYLEMQMTGMNPSQIAKAIGTNDVRVTHCMNCASLPEAVRELVHAGMIYTSNTFIAPLKEIADIDPAACIELAKEIAKKQPGLKAATKAANGVLAYLRNELEKGKGQNKRKKAAPVLDVAAYLGKADVDEHEPKGWAVLQQAGYVPEWTILTQSAVDVCKKCELHDIASPKMCSACTAAQMLASMAALTKTTQKVVEPC